MGLFDFLKKAKTDNSTAESKGGNSGSGDKASVFKGDLALISENNSDRKSDSGGTAPIINRPPAENKDSSDAVVFMTFPTTNNGNWVCPECGTKNEDSLNGCIVCGLRK